MTIYLRVIVDVAARERAPVARALRTLVRDVMMDNIEVQSLDDPGLCIGIIEEVTVTAT